MTIGVTYNAKVKGFNANGNVVLETPDGSIAVAQQTGNGVLVIGQPVVLQRSGIPGVSDVCFDPTATPTPVKVWRVDPEPDNDKGSIWVLYRYQGKLWVGGHQKAPEPVLDENGRPVETDTANASVFADGKGWEVTYSKDSITYISAKARSKSKAFSIGSGVVDSQVSLGSLLYKEGGFENVSNPGTVDGSPSSGGLAYSKTLSVGISDYSKGLKSSGVLQYSQVPVFQSTNNGTGSDSSNTISRTSSLTTPYFNLTSSETFSSRTFSRTEPGAGNNNSYTYTMNSSTIDWVANIRDRVWAVFTRIERQQSASASGTSSNAPVTESSSTSLALYAANDAAQVRLYDLSDSDPKDSKGRVISGNGFATLHFPVAVLLDESPTYTDALTGTIRPKYKHPGVKVLYTVKVLDVYRKTSLVNKQPVAELKAAAWGIPKDAVVLDASCWLPGLSKYINR